jgi:hypothetical protein
LGLAAVAAESLEAVRGPIDAEFRLQLHALADKCEELGLADQARETRTWLVSRTPGRQVLFAANEPEPPGAAPPSSDLAQKWLKRFLDIRRHHAARLFALAQQESQQGSATASFQLLHEVLHEDPAHAEAQRILQVRAEGERRPRSHAPRLAHSQFGWPRGRWWQIESAHFQIATDHSPETGIEMARRLEEFHSFWEQVLFEYWSNRATLREHFAGSVVKPPSQRKHRVVLFRDRQEYVQRLSAAEPQIAVTLGYYRKANQTAYFYAGDETLLSVWYHEATHQLFQERGMPIADVGEKWNFWAVEAVALYFESLTKNGGAFTLGGFDADRIQFARSRILGGEPQMPLEQLVRLGREDLQRHSEIRRLYSQCAALAHFFMDFDRGRYREKFVMYLAEVYLGTDSPTSMFERLQVEPEELERQLRSFLTVGESDLLHVRSDDSLRNLSLVRGEVSDDSLAHLAGCSRLEWLDLSFTTVTPRGLAHLQPLRGLQRLTLVGVPLDDTAGPELARLESLEELDLSGTRVTDAILPHVARLSKLKALRCSHTSLSNDGLMHLTALKQLVELDVEHTAVTEQGLTSLKQKLPKLK